MKKILQNKRIVKEKVSLKVQEIKESLDLEKWEDGLFMDDVRQATLRGAHPISHALFWVIGVLFIVFLLWANFAKLDEVTSGIGKVIPSSQVQTVQNREGGIVEEILVREGQVVNAGDILIRVGNTEFSASLAEKQSKRATLEAEIVRLTAEVAEEAPVFNESTSTDIRAAQMAMYRARLTEKESALSALKRQVEQREQEYKSLKTTREQKARAYELSQKELKMTRPLLKDGAVSEVEILRLERQVNDMLGEKEAAALDVPRAEAAVEESRQRLAEAEAKLQGEKLAELSEKKDMLSRLNENLKSDVDKVDRTAVRSPVKATVKRVLVNTVGGVIKPGMDLVELVPLEDSLLVEAEIRPKDIAFLRPDQSAQVKITAYDFSVYGDLDASLEHIGVDTVTNEDGEAFYLIRVRTSQNYLTIGERQLPIIPGMVAQVDILTGKKTVLDYLLKPFNKMRERALRER